MVRCVAARFSAPRPAPARPVAARLAALSSAALLLVVPMASAQQAAPQRGGETATSVTLYQDGRVLVRRAFPMRVTSGASTQRVSLGPVDPASLVSLDTAVAMGKLL